MEKDQAYYESLDKRSKEYKDWVASQNENDEVRDEVSEIDTTNPFNEGVSYEAFLENVTDEVSVDELLNKADLSKIEIEWIKEELNQYKTQ